MQPGNLYLLKQINISLKASACVDVSSNSVSGILLIASVWVKHVEISAVLFKDNVFAYLISQIEKVFGVKPALTWPLDRYNKEVFCKARTVRG